MRAFAHLLDRLALTGSRNAKLTLVRDFLSETPDPDRGWALAALTGELTFAEAKPAPIRKATEARVDPILFGWSYDFVGDLAETVALAWPACPGANREPELSEVVDALRGRWSVLPLAETDPTVRAHAQAEVLLDRYGVVTRGAVAAEQIAGGFAGVYRVLSAFEEAGRTRVRLLQVPGAGLDKIALDAVPSDAWICNAFEHEAPIAEYVMPLPP